jgi:DNA-binding LacI/PurR family transcriptional regulator
MTRPVPRDRVILGDVARRAGVSVSTASRALASDGRISLRTRTAVRAAAAELRYVPNIAARGLRVQATGTLGLLLADLGDPVHGQIAAAFEHEAGENGYRVIFASGLNDRDRERRALRTFVEHAADGVALVSGLLDPAEAGTWVAPGRLVVVQSDSRRSPRPGRTLAPGIIQTDDASGMDAVIDHLVGNGYRDIAYAGDETRATDVARHEAAELALRRHGIAGPLRRFSAPDHAWHDPEVVLWRILAEPPEALVCYDDKLALAIMDALRGAALRVPDDIGIVGFDGIPFAAMSNPRLTTVVTPTADLGRIAASSLIGAIHTGHVPDAIVLPVRLAVRESTRDLRAAVPRDAHRG